MPAWGGLLRRKEIPQTWQEAKRAAHIVLLECVERPGVLWRARKTSDVLDTCIDSLKPFFSKCFSSKGSSLKSISFKCFSSTAKINLTFILRQLHNHCTSLVTALEKGGLQFWIHLGQGMLHLPVSAHGESWEWAGRCRALPWDPQAVLRSEEFPILRKWNMA